MSDIIIIVCKDCKKEKPLGAYGICSDCFKSTTRYGGDKTLEHQANGVALCRFCKQSVPKGRRTFCGDNCVHEWQMRSNVQYARAQVFLRDNGVCALCDLDTIQLEKEMLELQSSYPDEWKRQWDEMIEQGWDRHRRLSLWDADHIIPVVEGGGLCGLENLRTLCIPCHRGETAELAKRSAERKRQHGETQPN